MRPTGQTQAGTRSLPAAGAPIMQHWARLLLIAIAAPLPVLAQPAGSGGDGFLFRRPVVTLTIRGGYDRPTASGDIYSFATTKLTANKGDFAAAGYQVDLAARVSERFELVASAGAVTRDIPSEFRKFIDNNDKPIEQVTRLNRFPLSIGVRYALTAPGERISRFAWIPNRISPWVGAGVGRMKYNFSQRGDFVDFQTLKVFKDDLSSNGWTNMGYANLGADVMLTTHLGVTGDLRYTAASASLNKTKFEGFGNINLSGAAATMGFTVRY
jgi:hypothetical protein